MHEAEWSRTSLKIGWSPIGFESIVSRRYSGRSVAGAPPLLERDGAMDYCRAVVLRVLLAAVWALLEAL